MRRLYLSAAGGIIIPFMYFALFTAFVGISDKWISDSLEEKLIVPLLWPVSLITYLFSSGYAGDFFSDFNGSILILTISLDFIAYSLLTYLSITWLEKSRRLP